MTNLENLLDSVFDSIYNKYGEYKRNKQNLKLKRINKDKIEMLEPIVSYLENNDFSILEYLSETNTTYKFEKGNSYVLIDIGVIEEELQKGVVYFGEMPKPTEGARLKVRFNGNDFGSTYNYSEKRISKKQFMGDLKKAIICHKVDCKTSNKDKMKYIYNDINSWDSEYIAFDPSIFITGKNAMNISKKLKKFRPNVEMDIVNLYKFEDKPNVNIDKFSMNHIKKINMVRKYNF